MTKLGVWLTAWLLALPLSVVAQELTITGTVADQTGGVLPGVTVEAVGPGPATRREASRSRSSSAWRRMADPRAAGAGVDFDW